MDTHYTVLAVDGVKYELLMKNDGDTYSIRVIPEYLYHTKFASRGLTITRQGNYATEQEITDAIRNCTYWKTITA